MVKFLRRIFPDKRPQWSRPRMVKTGVINIWEHRGWGDSINWVEWQKRVDGFYRHFCLNGDAPSRIAEGVVLSEKAVDDAGKKFKLFFLVTKSDYCRDPKDMFQAEVKLIHQVETEAFSEKV